MAKIGEDIKEAMISHAQGHIDKHKMNVMIYFRNSSGIVCQKHPDVLEAIEQELDVVARDDDQIEMLKKYF